MDFCKDPPIICSIINPFFHKLVSAVEPYFHQLPSDKKIRAFIHDNWTSFISVAVPVVLALTCIAGTIYALSGRKKEQPPVELSHDLFPTINPGNLFVDIPTEDDPFVNLNLVFAGQKHQLPQAAQKFIETEKNLIEISSKSAKTLVHHLLGLESPASAVRLYRQFHLKKNSLPSSAHDFIKTVLLKSRICNVDLPPGKFFPRMDLNLEQAERVEPYYLGKAR